MEGKTESTLFPMLAAACLIVGGMLAVAALLVLSGFLAAPFVLVVLFFVVSLGILGIAIGAAVLSRRPPEDSRLPP